MPPNSRGTPRSLHWCTPREASEQPLHVRPRMRVGSDTSTFTLRLRLRLATASYASKADSARSQEGPFSSFLEEWLGQAQNKQV